MEKNDFAIGVLPDDTKDAENPLLWLMPALVLAIFGTLDGLCDSQTAESDSQSVDNG
mgnify:CR=1 FL=1